LFIILINIFLNFLISRPIRKLDIFAKKLSKGNLEAKLILKNKDEFGRLSLTLNDMRRNLKNSYEKIKNHSEELEKIVEKRTKTLTETNIELEKSYQNLLESQEKIIYLAFHDDLTGLTNRRSCRDKMENMIKEMGNTGKKMAILYIGLDDFKNINDTFGPNTGDEILKVVSVRLLKIIKTRGDVARWGSDEFVVLMPSIKRNNEGIEIAKKIIKKISETFYIEDKYINITASIGISFFPDDGSDSEVLIKKSDFALYQAKKEGKNKYHLFDKNMYRKILYNLSIAEELKNSVIDRDFELYYQPKVNLNGDIVDLEALIRWESRKYGNICPDDFIPIAENSDIIIEIGNWVLKTACIQVMDFQKKGIVPIRISINMSPRHFRYPKLIQVIKEIIKETKCDTKWIEIEITETSAMEKIEESIEIIKEINNLGIKISIDDFGKGFSSFSRLIQMKFDSIKIDKSFIDNLTRDNNSIITVNSIISLAHNLNKEVVAEGVETEEQFNILKELKCDIYQGYLFAKPMKINDIEKLLKKQNKEI
ncbi:MAG: EAL domain-containing protein, partial [Spirochaetes bacterium]|nr:EAL domain-containing protein [Spirochaetota bacterium]